MMRQILGGSLDQQSILLRTGVQDIPWSRCVDFRAALMQCGRLMARFARGELRARLMTEDAALDKGIRDGERLADSRTPDDWRLSGSRSRHQQATLVAHPEPQLLANAASAGAGLPKPRCPGSHLGRRNDATYAVLAGASTIHASAAARP